MILTQHIRMYGYFTLAVQILLFFSLPAAVKASDELLIEAMTDHLDCYPLELVSLKRQEPAITRQDVCLASIYHEMGAVPLWMTKDGPTLQAETVLSYLQNADKEGLDPQDYQVGRIEELWQDRSFESLAVLDTLLTYNAVKYIHDVSHGQMKPFMADPKLFAEAGETAFDPVAAMEALFAAGDIEGYLDQLPPKNRHYRELKKALAFYRSLSADMPWRRLSGKKTISPGDRHEFIPPIRDRLALLFREEYEAEDGDETFYSPALEKVVLRFQQFHGLKVDGIIGKNTLAALNVSPAERVEQITLNMARWRWQDHDLGDDYVLVNIANFQLEAYRGGELRLSLPVIVGRLRHQTPVFSDSIKYIEFNPYWNVPPSIAIKEELPELQENPNYLLDKNIRLFSNWREDGVELDSTLIDWQLVTRREMAGYKLRQDPGPFNALGRVKFVFPNHYSVYIHDTPAKKLFSERHRSFSHGCIRLSSPDKFAEYVLRESTEGWSQEAIAETIESGKRKVVRLQKPLPIHITYQTAWVDKNGGIHFNRDVYARDEKLYRALLQK